MPIYIVAGMLVVSLALIAYALWPNKRGEAKETLRRRISERKGGRDAADLLKQQSKESVAQKMLQKVAPLAVRPVMPQNDAEMSKLRIKLANAGFRRENTPTLFLASKTVLAILVAVAALIFSITRGYELQKLLGITIFAAGIGFMGPNLWLNMAARTRIDQIRKGLPDSLDLLVITVESGLGLDAAMQRVGDELKNVHPVISEELQIATLEAQMGIPRAEALNNTAIRCGAPEMRSLVAIINQAEKFGTSVAQALRRQADALRVKRRQAAEEKAQKTTVKLMLPLIMFIFPAIFVVLGAPAALKILDAFRN